MHEQAWDGLNGHSAGNGSGPSQGGHDRPASSPDSDRSSRIPAALGHSPALPKGLPVAASQSSLGDSRPQGHRVRQSDPDRACEMLAAAATFSHQTAAAPSSVSQECPARCQQGVPHPEHTGWDSLELEPNQDEQAVMDGTPDSDTGSDAHPGQAAEDAERRGDPPKRSSRRRARSETTGAGRGLRIAWMAMMAVLLLALLRLNIGAIVEEICYGLERGKQRAKLEDARVQLAKLEDTSTAFRLIARSIGPCVVHIDTLRVNQTARRDGDDGWSRRLEASGQGSGVIVDPEGFILTNHHVIKDATEIVVRLSDGRNIRGANVVGIDPLTDLAVIKIDAQGLQAAPWGDSESLEVGDWVVAVGNPFGLDRSVTAGIVSAKGRRNVVHNMPYQNFLQTDAAVNPGNSGGPLINLQGEVVGINTAIVGSSFQGVSFAIPSTIAREVYTRLRSEGQFVRGWLGVALEEITLQRAAELGVEPQGVLVTDVVGAPARQAGLEAGDIVLTWNGQSVSSPADLSWKVAATNAGSHATIRLKRGNEELELIVRVGERRL